MITEIPSGKNNLFQVGNIWTTKHPPTYHLLPTFLTIKTVVFIHSEVLSIQLAYYSTKD